MTWENPSPSGILHLSTVNCVLRRETVLPIGTLHRHALAGWMLMVAPTVEGIDLFTIAGRSISGWKKRSGKWLEERASDANFSHETVSPSASAERGQPPPPARAAERGAAPQTDPHRCPRWLWENHAGQRMGRGNRATEGPYRLAVAGRRGERPHTLSDVPGRCFTDDCGQYWGRGVGYAPILSATANRSNADDP